MNDFSFDELQAISIILDSENSNELIKSGCRGSRANIDETYMS